MHQMHTRKLGRVSQRFEEKLGAQKAEI